MSAPRRTFQVHCPACSTGFPIDSAKVPPQGIAAICSTCETVFPVYHPPAEEALQTVEAGGGAPLAVDVTLATVEVVVEEPLDPAVPPVEVVVEEPLDLTVPPVEVVVEEPLDLTVPPVEVVGEEPLDISEPPVEVVPPVDAEVVVEPEPEPAVEEWRGAEEVDASPPAAPEPPPPVSKPRFEDLSSFTNEVLAESTREAPPPIVEKERAAPEKVERFGKRDPHERARHLARVLVSDIIAYYPVRYQESLARRTLEADFGDEIQKSYREYIDQVGIEMAESTPYFTDALNHVLGRGEKFF